MNDRTIARLANKIERLEKKVARLSAQETGRWKMLRTALTSTSWDGDARSTTAKTLIDLSAVFGVPAGVRAVLVNAIVNDSASAGSTTFYGIILAPDNAANVGLRSQCNGITNDAKSRAALVVPCDSNGDIYYQTSASGSLTLDVWLRIWGYLY